MDTQEVSRTSKVMKTRTAFLLWVGCLAIFIALLNVGAEGDPNAVGEWALIFYIAAGIFLNRAVLRRLVEWHPVYNTLGNVTSDKIRFFALWPIAYLILFVRLGINKLL